MKPLAELMRPSVIDDFIGQETVLGVGKPLYNLISSKKICNCIFYGPPGTGKTTLANIIANHVDKKFYKLNATTASIKDIQDITSNLDNLLNYHGVILYIDEIQNFNKKQQQALLQFIEDGRITLIASTTENPYFAIYNAIISRCNIFRFEPLTRENIVLGLKKSINKLTKNGLDVNYEIEALNYIADISQGDYRKSYNILELAINSQLKSKISITIEYVQSLGQSSIRGDVRGDEFYNLLSALQKSIRGSDVDASIHYLARLIDGGNLAAILRRISVIVAEDIGLAHPNALTVVNSGVELVNKVGLPEGRIILSELVIYLATLPKSNSAYIAIKNAMKDLESKNVGDIPSYLKDAHYKGASNFVEKGYKYPHDYENNYTKQEYLPKELKGTVYYEPQNNKYEKTMENYWKNIKHI